MIGIDTDVLEFRYILFTRNVFRNLIESFCNYCGNENNISLLLDNKISNLYLFTSQLSLLWNCSVLTVKLLDASNFGISEFYVLTGWLKNDLLLLYIQFFFFFIIYTNKLNGFIWSITLLLCTNRTVYNCFVKLSGRMMKHLSFISSWVVRLKRVFNGNQRRVPHISRDFDNGPFLLCFILLFIYFILLSLFARNIVCSNVASTRSRRLLITRSREPQMGCGNRARNLHSEIWSRTKTKCPRSQPNGIFLIVANQNSFDDQRSGYSITITQSIPTRIWLYNNYALTFMFSTFFRSCQLNKSFFITYIVYTRVINHSNEYCVNGTLWARTYYEVTKLEIVIKTTKIKHWKITKFMAKLLTSQVSCRVSSWSMTIDGFYELSCKERVIINQNHC